MRNVEYISPSSISVFESDREEYYIKYLAEERPPRLPQTTPMAVGSAFDAYVKSYLHMALFGPSEEFDLGIILRKQVESHNLKQATVDGSTCMKAYQISGALGDLMLEMEESLETPRLEFEIRKNFQNKVTQIGDITLLGKPDIKYKSKGDQSVILDFKVNGFYSQASPMQGYVRIRDGWRDNPSRNAGEQHKDAHLMVIGGITVNIADYLENFNESWATQLAIYAWLCGEEIGSDFIIAIDQLCCKPGKIRIAEHRLRISREFQEELFKRICYMWEVIHSNHIFRDLTHEKSKDRCSLLDQQAEALKGDSVEDKWFSSVTRKY